MFFKKIYPMLLIIFMIFAGIAVQYLPNNSAEENIRHSCQTIILEKSYPAFYGRTADGYTDSVMLLISRSLPDKASWKRFFASPIYSYFDDKYVSTGTKLFPTYALCYPEDTHYRASYFRYWHGYQIILRPLLSFTDYNGIRKINQYLQPFLFAVLLYLFCKRKAYGLILGWILSYIILNPESMPYNMTYSIIYYIAVISSILMLTYMKKIEQNIGWPTYFMMIGIATNYFDFLTYPIVSLAVPLTVWFYVYPPDNFKNMCKNLFILGGIWIVGYAGMWLLKWVLCYFILGDFVVENIINAIIDRSESHIYERSYPFWSALTETFRQLCIQPDTVFAIVLSCIASIIAVIIKLQSCIRFAKQNYYQLLSFVAISMGVVVYCLIIQGHPFQHGIYAYRLWVTFFFPIIAGMNFWVINADKKRTTKRKRKKK